jgi:hypothetical protein
MKEPRAEERHRRKRRIRGNHELHGMRVLSQGKRRRNGEAGGRQEQGSQQHAGD